MGIAKLLVAWSRGKSNVGFLVILTGVFAFATYRVLRPPRQTPAGKRYLAWLRESHLSLLANRLDNSRSPQGDLALAAGIFGIAAITSVPEMNRLRQAMQPASSGSGDSGSDSGSGCGGGDSGGSSCGGGGCGGCGGGD
jgi:uncharacterized membrane protein YgcG